MRTGMVVLLLGALVAADDLRTARKLLVSQHVRDRLRGIDLLVRLDTKGAIQALEDAIKRSARQMDRLSVAMDRTDDQWFDAYLRILNGAGARGSPEMRAALRREAALKRELDRLTRDLQLHLQVVQKAGEAFGKLRSPDAIEKIEAGAKSEPNPTARMMYVTGLGHPSRARSVSVLLELTDHKDGRIRAAAVRSLVFFARAPGVLDRARQLAEDPTWVVRLGAYQVFVGAPFAVGVEELVKAAVRERGEMAVAVDSFLEGLTGRSFAQKPKRWNLWWKEHAAAIRAGTWKPDPDAKNDEAQTVARFFRIPIQSERLVFALDFSGSMEEDFRVKDAEIKKMLERYRLDETRLGYAQAEFIRAINAMPDGALFNIIGYSTGVRRFSGRLVKLTPSTRKRAVRWVMRLKTDKLTNLYAALAESFKDYLSTSGGAVRFKDLPDTIIFLTDGIATRGRFQETEPLRQVVQVWNRPLDIVIHTVGIGRDHDRQLLRALAADTGGYYVDVDKGLKDLKPRRRRMPPGLELIRKERERHEKDVREVAARLKSNYAENRQSAAEKLGAMGPRAEPAIDALVAVLADAEEPVRRAAADALVKIGDAALPALTAAVASTDAETVMSAARALTEFGARARGAVPALEKATAHSDPRAAEAAAQALEKIRG